MRQQPIRALRALVEKRHALGRANFSRKPARRQQKRPGMMVHYAAPPVVLVVEDEMLLRMRAVDMVEDAGYLPVEAADADEAVEILEARSDIAVLFTDIQMPGDHDGVALAVWARKAFPSYQAHHCLGSRVVRSSGRGWHEHVQTLSI